MSDTFLYSDFWKRICSALDSKYPIWRDRIISFGQVSMIEKRESGHHLTDNEIFAGIVKAVLTGATDFSRIEKILPELSDLFQGYDVKYYSSLTENVIESEFIPWFEERWAGGLTLHQNLFLMVKTARELQNYINRFGSLEKYLSALFKGYSDPISVTEQLGSSRSPRKLPAMGIPIAAEMMKNIGYDVAKPDRHLNRALGCFGMVIFSKWKDRSSSKAPQATENEMIQTMREMKLFAKSVNEKAALLDNAIWMLCANSGLCMSNSELMKMV